MRGTRTRLLIMAAIGFADALIADVARAGGAPLGRPANIPPMVESFRLGLSIARVPGAKQAHGAEAPVR